MKIITLDLSEFGGREKRMVRDLLNAYLIPNKDKTKLFNGVSSIVFNQYSGEILATDEDGRVAIESDGELHDYFSCPECGNEGIEQDFDTSTRCCADYYKQVTES